MFNAFQGLCTSSSSDSRGLIVTAESYSLLYSFQSPCGFSSSLYEGAVCGVFKMVLQSNTCKLLIQCIALPAPRKHGHIIFALSNGSKYILDF